jgi:predicted lipid-binding transport protein (Tim44 family)
MDETEQQLEEGLEHLKNIQEELSELKEQTANPWASFARGILQGAGAIVGGIAAIILLGWVLYVMGLIPGFGTIVHSIQDAMGALHR